MPLSSRNIQFKCNVYKQNKDISVSHTFGGTWGFIKYDTHATCLVYFFLDRQFRS